MFLYCPRYTGSVALTCTRSLCPRRQVISRARGEAKAIVNAATAEATSIREVSRALGASGEDPTKYLLALKYMEALESIMALGCKVLFLPQQTSFVQTARDMVGSVLLSTNAVLLSS